MIYDQFIFPQSVASAKATNSQQIQQIQGVDQVQRGGLRVFKKLLKFDKFLP